MFTPAYMRTFQSTRFEPDPFSLRQHTRLHMVGQVLGKPLANTEALAHAVSHYTAYRHLCYSVVIIIKVSRSSNSERCHSQLGFRCRTRCDVVRFAFECFKCNSEVICMDSQQSATSHTRPDMAESILKGQFAQISKILSHVNSFGFTCQDQQFS